MNNNKLAFIYDFDGTLSKGFLGDDCLIYPYGDNGQQIWQNINDTARENNIDVYLLYLYFFKGYIKSKKPQGMSLKDFFRQHIDKANLFPGVAEWFDKINEVGKKYGLEIEHYIVSAGIRGLIVELPFANKCRAIYASDYMIDENDNPVWLSSYVSATSKTEYLFRISKGNLENFEMHKIFDKKDKDTRPIRFDNMIYFGDGATDVPAMKVVRRKGGHAVAVFGDKSQSLAEKLLDENRVDNIFKADYREDSELFKYIEEILKEKANTIKIEK